jgi:DNA polymerase I-like protein with 3'-5' exonuclease and polymerase domains
MVNTLCSLDFETTRIKNNKVEGILGYAWTVKDDFGGYQTKSSVWKGEDSIAHLKELAEKYTLIFHSAQFELYILERFLGIPISRFHDTQIMSYIWCPGLEPVAVHKGGKVDMQVHSLGAWGVRLGNHKIDNSVFDWTEFTEEMAIYCRQDAELTFKLFEHLEPLLKSDAPAWQCYQNIDLPFVRCVVEMQQNGLMFDKAELRKFTESRAKRCEELILEIRAICPIAPGKAKSYKREQPEEKLGRFLGGLEYLETVQEPDTRKAAQPGDVVDVFKYRVWEEFNPSSSKQVAWALTDLYGWEASKFTEAGSPSVGGEVLEELTEYPLASLLCEFSHEQKLVDSFGEGLIEKFDENDRVYPSINNALTLTGRLSSSQPNCQQFPSRGELGKEFRKTVVARPGYKLVGADKSSFQLKILAYFLYAVAGNDAFWSRLKSGIDPHTATATIIFNKPASEVTKTERSVAKQINFALAFGSGAKKVAETITKSGTPTTELEAAGYLETVGDTMGLNTLKHYVWELARQQGGLIHDLYGRRLWYPDICSNNKQLRARAERQLFNAIIQGTEATIMKMLTVEALAAIRLLGFDARLLVQVHDEDLFEVVETQAEAFAEALTGIFSNQEYLPGFGSAIEPAGIGNNWAEAH